MSNRGCAYFRNDICPVLAQTLPFEDWRGGLRLQYNGHDQPVRVVRVGVDNAFADWLNMPAVSVVLPVFNGARTIARAAESILDQTFRDLELIVVDDGSTDETAGIVAELRDPRLRLIQLDHHSGVAAAANVGTEAATSPYIARMDADDFSRPQRMEKQLALLRWLDVDVVGCQVQILDEAHQLSRSMQRYQRWINQETLSHSQIHALRFVELPLVNPTILARREYFELKFRNDDLPEDYELLLRAAAEGMRFGKVRETLFDWYEHGGRLTRNDARYTPESFMRCRRKYFLSGPLCDVPAVDLWGVGKTGKPWLRWLQSKEITVRNAYEVNERKIGDVIHGVPVSHGNDLLPNDGTPLVVAVGAESARGVILPQIVRRGYVPGRNAWFVA